MKNTYVFPAVFSYAVDGISVEFPDLPGCLPLGYTIEEAVKSARSCLELHIYGMEKDGEGIPEPTDVRNVTLGENEAVMLVEASMVPFREKMANRYVKKTLTIPAWLNYEAEAAGVNFSQLLQSSLKEHLQLIG